MNEDNIHLHQRNHIISRVLVLMAIPADSDINAAKLLLCDETRLRSGFKVQH